jgi:hypothetical protein
MISSPPAQRDPNLFYKPHIRGKPILKNLYFRHFLQNRYVSKSVLKKSTLESDRFGTAFPCRGPWAPSPPFYTGGAVSGSAVFCSLLPDTFPPPPECPYRAVHPGIFLVTG